MSDDLTDKTIYNGSLSDAIDSDRLRQIVRSDWKSTTSAGFHPEERGEFNAIDIDQLTDHDGKLEKVRQSLIQPGENLVKIEEFSAMSFFKKVMSRFKAALSSEENSRIGVNILGPKHQGPHKP